MNHNIDISQEINFLTNRHIAKILTWLDEKQLPLDSVQESAVKKQFRFLQDDITNLISEVQNGKQKQ